MITTEQIKSLREKTNISIAQCKKALEEAGGDEAKALEILKSKGAEIAGKKSDRELGSGAIGSYVHSNNSMGALVLLASETDFVSGNTDFKTLADDLAMHVAASAPENLEEFMAQPFIKDPSLTIEAVVQGAVQKFGERVIIANFSRLSL